MSSFHIQDVMKLKRFILLPSETECIMLFSILCSGSVQAQLKLNKLQVQSHTRGQLVRFKIQGIVYFRANESKEHVLKYVTSWISWRHPRLQHFRQTAVFSSTASETNGAHLLCTSPPLHQSCEGWHVRSRKGKYSMGYMLYTMGCCERRSLFFCSTAQDVSCYKPFPPAGGGVAQDKTALLQLAVNAQVEKTLPFDAHIHISFHFMPDATR